VHTSWIRIGSAIALLVVLTTAWADAEPIGVRFGQGSSHGFHALETLDGKLIATGESTQTVHGDRVIARLIFRFRDGSIDDDLTVFTQRGVFRLISDHHIQHGPSFPRPIDFLIDAPTGDLITRAQDGTFTKEHMDLPADVSNGLPPNLLLNILPSTAETRISYVVPGKKPRLIQVSIKPTGSLAFTVGGLRRRATDFTLHVELGGVASVIAPMIGRQPADYHIWLQSGAPPAFVREEGPLYEGGPTWRIEEISPTIGR
jgi:hypothetical protein